MGHKGVMMRADNNTVALGCVTIIVIVALVMRIEGAKEIALTIAGAIGGWMAKERA
jgi:hypothetical protein